jgi:S-adenosyl methyltransferase
MKGTGMTSDEPTAPSGRTASKTGPLPFDTSMANQARVYDYLLGGKDNYAADRVAAEAALEVAPETVFTCRANRAFLGRVVRYLADQAGMRQFLDIGTGIPTSGNTHQVAQEIAPETRVVYVDYDPIVLAHARALLTSHEAGATEYIDADLRDTDTVLSRARELLDFGKPVAITLIAILHAIPDSDDPHEIVARLLDAIPSGSYIALSHIASDILDGSTQRGLENVVGRLIQQQLASRSRDEVARFFKGTDLVAPGLVRVEQWHPDGETGDASRSYLWCGVGRKR